MSLNASANSYFDIALAKPTITERCRELMSLIDECSTKLLHNNFTNIIHHIFGVNTVGWGILTANPRHQAMECQVLKDFLGCRGPMFRLLHRLQIESMLFRYDFPCSMLPPSFVYIPGESPIQQTRLQQQLYNIGGQQSEARFSPMGATCMNSPQTACIRVSAFEFYFYHFAHCIVKTPTSYRQPLAYFAHHQLPPTMEENLYYLLVDEYLLYFLPIDGSSLPVMQISSPANQSTIGSYPLNASVSALLRRSTAKQSTNIGGTRHEMWRSDVVVHIFVEFWLGQWVLKRGDHRNLVSPSEDLMRAVRRLVKHLHYFNNTNMNLLTNPHSQFNDSSLDVFKQNIMYNCLQPRLFTFLCYCFKVWPLNSTFRVVLETWLSYIQPWRYTDPSNVSRNVEMRLNSDREIANVWYHFISNNLQFYTRLFYESINRFLRMDISKQANSLLLHRVAKIFSQPNLFHMIEEAEIAMYGDRHALYPQPHGSYIALSRSETSTSISPQPYLITSEELRKMVNQQLTVCNQALGTVKKYTQPRPIDVSTQFLSFIGLGALTEMSGQSLLNANWKKSEQQIQDSMTLLANLFDLSIPDLEEVSLGPDQIANPLGPEAPDYTYDDDGKVVLSELGRYEVINNVKRLPVYPNAGPDLQPIRSFENRFLVRLLYRVSTAINAAYGTQFQALCSQRNVLGTWARPLLLHDYEHSPSAKVKDWQNLPPRISLRKFAHYRTILYVFLYFLICQLIGVSFLRGLAYLTLFFFLLSVFKALLKEYVY